MPQTHISGKLAIVLVMVFGSVFPGRTGLFGQATSGSPFPATTKLPANADLMVESPVPHSPPILTPPTSLLGLWSQLSAQTRENAGPNTQGKNARVFQRVLPVIGIPQQPTGVQAGSNAAVEVPLSDETEQAIAEVRRRLGTARGRFSDLLRPEDEARLFAEALSQVRQEQQLPATPQGAPSPNSPSVPVAPHYSVPPQVQSAPGVQTPAPLPPLAGRPPVPLPAPPFGTQSATQPLHWAPGQPSPTAQSTWPVPGKANFRARGPKPPAVPSPPLGSWNPRGTQLGQPRLPQPAQWNPAAGPEETERAAMRRIAREVEALAEQLENIKRYSEADSLRRTAQQFREAVR